VFDPVAVVLVVLVVLDVGEGLLLEVIAPVEDAPPVEEGDEVSKRARVGEINSPLAANGCDEHA